MNDSLTGLIQNTWQCYVQRAVLRYYLDTNFGRCAVLQLTIN